LPDSKTDTGAPETVVTAQAKFHCPACGGEAQWNPAKQLLICPFCGTESPATLETRKGDTVIVEHDLVAALRDIPDEARGWQATKTTVQCQSCRAISVFDPDKIGQRCAFCGSTELVPYADVKDAFRPESLLPLKIAESQARDLIRAWYQRLCAVDGRLGDVLLHDVERQARASRALDSCLRRAVACVR
jgi:Zn finger protein HypA/HybF involved in hydrogenase expression